MITLVRQKLLKAIQEAQRGEQAKASIGPMLRSWREGEGVSQADLAIRLDVSQAFLCDVELARREFGEEKLQTLAEVLDKCR